MRSTSFFHQLMSSRKRSRRRTRLRRTRPRRTRPRRTRPRRTIPTNLIDSLPDEVLFKILVEHLSAEEIHESARLVCRKWHQLTKTPDFVQEHLRRSNDMLLFQSTDDPKAISLGHGRVEISNSRLTLRQHFYAAGCNGLVLAHNAAFKGTLGVVNPVTKQMLALPYINGVSLCSSGVAYASVSMVYKVVVPTLHIKNLSVHLCTNILTVGVDTSWRTVPSAHIFIGSVPLITQGGGFMHWCVELSNRVLTMDMETEVTKETPPPFPEDDGRRKVYLSAGEYLSLLVSCGEYLWQVWEMKPQTGEWRLVAGFSLAAFKSMFERWGESKSKYIDPIGWLRYPHVLVFQLSDGNQPRVFSYYLVTRKIESIELPYSSLFCTRLIHKNSLVRV